MIWKLADVLRKKPKNQAPKVPAKSIRREYRLDFEQLEKRELFSVGFGLPHRPSSAEGFTNTTHELAWFMPSVSGLSRLSHNDTGSLSITATATLDVDGDYEFTVSIAGSNASGSFALVQTGTSSFHWHTVSSFASGVYTTTTQSFTQDIDLDWSFQQWNTSSQLIRDDDDSYSFTSGEEDGLAFDGFRWYAFNWRQFTSDLSDEEGFNLDGYTWSSLTVSESGTTSYTFHEAGGKTLTGSGTADLGQGRPGVSGTETYSYSGSPTFSFDQHGSGSFSLYEAGSRASNGAYSLSSFLYQETGANSHVYNEQGGKSLSGNGAGSANASISRTLGDDYESTETYSVSGSESYSYGGSPNYSYAESGSGTYSVYESGQYANGSFSLNSLVRDERGSGSYVYQESGTQTWGGSGGGTGDHRTSGDGTVALNGGEASGSDAGSFTSNGTYNFGGTSNHSYTLDGSGTFHLHQEGSFAGGSYGLSSVLYDENATKHYHSLETGNRWWNGSDTYTMGSNASSTTDTSNGGTDNLGVIALGGTGQENYAYSGSSTYSYEQWSTTTYQLHQTGQANSGGYNLSCVVYHETGNGSYLYESDGFQSYAGGGIQTTTSSRSSNSTTSFGGLNSGSQGSFGYSDSGTYGYSGSFSDHYDEAGTSSWTEHDEGSQTGGEYNLSSVAYQSEGTTSFTWTASGSDTSSRTGTTVDRNGNAGSGTFSLAGNAQTSNGGYSSVSTVGYQTSSSSTYSFATNGNSEFDWQLVGNYANGSFSYSSSTYDMHGTFAYENHSTGTATLHQTSTTNTTSNNTFITSGAASDTTALNYGNTGTYSFDGTWSWNANSNGGNTYALYQHGQMTGGVTWSLDSILYDERGTYGYDQLQKGRTNVGGTYVATQGGSASTDTSTLSGTSTVAYHGTDSYTNTWAGNGSYVRHEPGTYGNHSYTMDGFTFQTQENSVGTYASQGTETWDGISRTTQGVSDGTIAYSSTDSSTYHAANNYSTSSRSLYSYALNEAGSYALGSWTLTSYEWTSGGSGTYAYHQDYSTDSSGVVTFTESGANHAGLGTTTYNSQSTYVSDSSGTWTSNDHYQGSFANYSWQWTDYSYTTTGTGSYHIEQTTEGEQTVDSLSTTVESGATTVRDSSSYDYASTSWDGGGLWSTSFHEGGEYNHGSWSLDSVTYRSGSVSSSTASSEGNDNSSTNETTGSDSSVIQGTTGYDYTGSSRETFSYSGDGTYAALAYSWSTTTYDVQGDSQATWHQTSAQSSTITANGSTSYKTDSSLATGTNTGDYHQLNQGSFANGSWSIGTYQWDQSATDTTTSHGEGTSSRTNAASSYVFDSVEHSHVVWHEKGSFSNGNWALSSYLYDKTADSLSTRHDQGHSNGTLSGEAVEWGGGTTGYAPGSTFQETFTKDDNKSVDYHLHQEATYANGSYSFASHTLHEEQVTDYEFHDDIDVSYMGMPSHVDMDDTSLVTKTTEEVGLGSLATTTITTESDIYHYRSSPYEYWSVETTTTTTETFTLLHVAAGDRTANFGGGAAMILGSSNFGGGGAALGGGGSDGGKYLAGGSSDGSNGGGTVSAQSNTSPKSPPTGPHPATMDGSGAWEKQTGRSKSFIVNADPSEFDLITWLAGVASHLWSADKVDGRTVEGAVDKILGQLGPEDTISRVEFWGHGGPGAMKVGDNWITKESFKDPTSPEYAALDKLRKRLAPDAVIYFRGCEVFRTPEGKEFAEAASDFFDRKVAGHTCTIGAGYEPGYEELDPGEKAGWSDPWELFTKKKNKAGFKAERPNWGEIENAWWTAYEDGLWWVQRVGRGMGRGFPN